MKWFFKNFEELVSGIALAGIILIVIFNVSMRYFLSKSFNWAEEAATIGFAWCVFVGASACYKRGMHIGIDIVVNFFPAGLSKTVALGTNVLMIITNFYLTYLSLVFALSAWTKTTPVMMIHYTFVDISATVGFGMMSIHSIIDLINEIKGKKKTQGDEGQIQMELSI